MELVVAHAHAPRSEASLLGGGRMLSAARIPPSRLKEPSCLSSVGSRLPVVGEWSCLRGAQT